MREVKKDFTLVELLAVIVILGIIVVIAVPAVGNVINKLQEKSVEAEIEIIKDAARIYFTTDEEAIKKIRKNDLDEQHEAMVGAQGD